MFFPTVSHSSLAAIAPHLSRRTFPHDPLTRSRSRPDVRIGGNGFLGCACLPASGFDYGGCDRVSSGYPPVTSEVSIKADSTNH